MKESRSKVYHTQVEIIFYIVLVIVTMLILFWYFLKPAQGNIVEVRVSGKVVATYPLMKDKKVHIKGKENGENILIMKGGKAKMEEADCPDKICAKSKEIYRVGESIICLPHEVVIEIKRENLESQEGILEQKEDDVDVIAK